MMVNAADRGGAPQRGIGPDVKRVTVTGTPDASTGYIDTRDELGVTISVAPIYQVQPQKGETWIITKALGPWSFAARVGAEVVPAPTTKPVVHRPNSKYYYDDPTTTDLVNALETLGLITVIRS